MNQGKSAGDCGCGCGENGGSGACEHNKLKRPRYFHGMLLDEKDFLAEQAYHAAKRRMLNRMLHGWGVVCGLELEWKRNRRWVRIHPGMALDCFGNEIWVSQPYEVDMARLLDPPPVRTRQPCDDQAESSTTDWYLCLQYHETLSDPVPVYVSGGDCGAHTCEFSRVQEGFCVKLLDTCPDPGPPCGLVSMFAGEPCERFEPRGESTGGCLDADCDQMENEEDRRRCRAAAEFCSRSIPCPDCGGHSCNSHCVVIGKVTVNDQGCVQRACANDGCRRYVTSGRMVEYLATSLLAGAEKLIGEDGQKGMVGGEKIPSVHQIVANPIYALCWAFQRLGDDGGERAREVLSTTVRRVRKAAGNDDSGAVVGEQDTGVEEQQNMTLEEALQAPQAAPAAEPAPAPTATRSTRRTTRTPQEPPAA